MIARALEHNGAKVYILGRREEVLKTAAKQNAVRLAADPREKGSDIDYFSSMGI